MKATDPLSFDRARLTQEQAQAADEILAEIMPAALPHISYNRESGVLTIRAIKGADSLTYYIGPEGVRSKGALVPAEPTVKTRALAPLFDPDLEIAETTRTLKDLLLEIAAAQLGPTDTGAEDDAEAAHYREAQVYERAMEINAHLREAAARADAEFLAEISQKNLLWTQRRQEWEPLAEPLAGMVDPTARAGRQWQVNKWAQEAVPTLLEAGVTPQEIGLIIDTIQPGILATAGAAVLRAQKGQDVEVEYRCGEDATLGERYREILEDARSSLLPHGSEGRFGSREFDEKYRSRVNVPPIGMDLRQSPTGPTAFLSFSVDPEEAGKQVDSLRSRLRGFCHSVQGPVLPTPQFVLAHSRAEIFRQVVLLSNDLYWRLLRCLEENGPWPSCLLEEEYGREAGERLRQLHAWRFVRELRSADPGTGEVSYWYWPEEPGAIYELFPEEDGHGS